MKVYKFYLYKKVIRREKYVAISEDNIFETSSGKYACLYGFTDNKIIKNEFMEYRNMNIFKLKEDNMSKDDYEIYRQTYPDEELEYSSFGTTIVENDVTKIRPIQLVVSNKESSMIYLDYDMIAEGSLYDIFNSISRDNSFDEFHESIITFSNIFKHDIRAALEYLEFTNVMFDYFSPDSAEMPFKSFEEDKLMAYIKLFGNTYKDGIL